jgi:hypothetical protein
MILKIKINILSKMVILTQNAAFMTEIDKNNGFQEKCLFLPKFDENMPKVIITAFALATILFLPKCETEREQFL